MLKNFNLVGWLAFNGSRTVLLNKCAKLREYIKLIFKGLF